MNFSAHGAGWRCGLLCNESGNLGSDRHLCLSILSLLKIVLAAVLVLYKEPSEYDDENEDEYDPLDLTSVIA